MFPLLYLVLHALAINPDLFLSWSLVRVRSADSRNSGVMVVHHLSTNSSALANTRQHEHVANVAVFGENLDRTV
jgi:hypothetical protein